MNVAKYHLSESPPKKYNVDTEHVEVSMETNRPVQPPIFRRVTLET